MLGNRLKLKLNISNTIFCKTCWFFGISDKWMLQQIGCSGSKLSLFSKTLSNEILEERVWKKKSIDNEGKGEDSEF